MGTKLCFLVFICMLGMNDVIARKTTEVSTEFIDQLFQKTSQEQVLEDVPFIPYKQWRQAKGLFRSVLKFNFHGPEIAATARRLLEIFDNNMYSTIWVTATLLEAFQYGDAPKPSDNELILALNAIYEFHDKNKPYNTSTLTFWPQVYNPVTKFWDTVADNLVNAFTLVGGAILPQVKAYLKLLGYGDLIGHNDSIVEAGAALRRVFSIPPDLDDTLLNLGLGSMLQRLRDVFPGPSSLWNSQNSNITSAFDALKKYAYRPFSDDPNSNIIDPRSYFYMRKFLDEAKSRGMDVALAPTWMQTIPELQNDFKQGHLSTLLFDCIDIAITADIIFGITSSILSGLVDPQILNDPLIAQLYLNTTSFLAFEIKTNFSDRYDLALSFFPSQIEVYWFVTRSVAILETARRNGAFPVPEMDIVYSLLKDVTENDITNFILSQAKSVETDKIYLDDFLGDGDFTYDNKPLIRGEDRIFTTSMAANALIYTWTVYDENTKTTHWKDGVPDSVQDTITGCISWLTEHALDGRYEPWNAFSSFSVKDFNSIPFWYPANFFEDVNRTAISDWSFMPDTMSTYAVKGYIPKEQYEAMLKERHFGYSSHNTFEGYNNPTATFILWSSDAFTYASTLLAVSRYRNIVD